MKTWGELTETGKLRRLRPLVFDALGRYAIKPEGVRLVGGFTNAVYRIDTATERYALRIDYMEDHPDESTAVELAWLQGLAATDLDVCRVVPTADGNLSTYAEGPGVPGARRCVLFEWVPGAPLADRLSPARYHALGKLSASLRLHGASFDPPLRPMAWDKIFYWPEDLDPVVVWESRHRHHFSEGRMQTLQRAIEIIEPAFAELDPADAHIVHGDLHPWNVHVYRNRLIALDFEDVAWAHPVQDVATTLFYERNHADHADLRNAFEAGYRSITDWPVDYPGQLECFMAARTIMFVNFVLNLDEEPESFFEHAFPRLEAFVAEFG